jgi:hypothetical protein
MRGEGDWVSGGIRVTLGMPNNESPLPLLGLQICHSQCGQNELLPCSSIESLYEEDS